MAKTLRSVAHTEWAMWEAFHAGRIGEAVALAKQIPQRGRAKCIQATVAWRNGQCEFALGLAGKAIGLAPEDLEVLAFYARIQMEIGDTDKALWAYDAAGRLDPSVERAIDYALALLNVGNFKLGWEVYEARARRELAKQGAIPAAGVDQGPLQILHEGGFGDTIQFCRLLRSYGLTQDLTLRVPQALVRLMERSFPGVRVVSEAEALPSVLMMSLPYHLGLRPGDVTGEPYLRAARGNWFGPKVAVPRIGVAWAGSPNAPRDLLRSLQSHHLQALVEGLRPAEFVMIQQGPRQEDWPEGVPVAKPLILDFYDTAQVMLECDLVVTVDTSVAHLGGALGVPTWVMAPTVPDFRWSPHNPQWYKSVRVFRQTSPGDWAGVIQQIGREAARERVACH